MSNPLNMGFKDDITILIIWDMNSLAQQSTIDAYSNSIFAHVVFKPVWAMSIFPTKSLTYRHSIVLQIYVY